MFQMGEVISLMESDNKIMIRDLYNKTITDLELNNIQQFQYMPVIGDIVLYFNIDDKIQKVVKIWNIKDTNFIRQREYPLLEGELQITGIIGQYIYLNKKGEIKFVDSTMLNIFELTVEGLLAKIKKFEIDTYDGISLIIDKDITITRKSPNAEEDEDPIFSTVISDDGINIKHKSVEIIIDTNNVITVKGDKIQLGSGILGDVMTGGASGTHPIDIITGTPLMGSTIVKAQG
jgi:hypothetical protein